MYCKHVEFENFRNIKSAKIEFSPGVNVIKGKNAQGKTNCLEGIYLCAAGRSHRTPKDKHFIGFGGEVAKISLKYEDSRRENTLDLRYSALGRRYCAKNGVAQKKLSDFVGNFRAVLFTPEHLSIVKNGPALRRSFLDSALSQVSKEYLVSAQRYEKILQNRNKILQNTEYKSPKSIMAELEPYTLMLCKESEYIGLMRQKYVDRLAFEVKAIFDEMSGGAENVELIYSEVLSQEEQIKRFENNFQKEIAAGVTLYGVHKDDILININSFEARSFASQGQQRSIALAMKLSEGMLTKDYTGETPIYLFDDVLSELDAMRRAFIVSCLNDKQVILTTCDEVDAKNARLINCADGKFWV